jgi:hypothetical protein
MVRSIKKYNLKNEFQLYAACRDKREGERSWALMKDPVSGVVIVYDRS